MDAVHYSQWKLSAQPSLARRSFIQNVIRFVMKAVEVDVQQSSVSRYGWLWPEDVLVPAYAAFEMVSYTEQSDMGNSYCVGEAVGVPEKVAGAAGAAAVAVVAVAAAAGVVVDVVVAAAVAVVAAVQRRHSMNSQSERFLLDSVCGPFQSRCCLQALLLRYPLARLL